MESIKNNYHSNFIPQIPNQLISRYLESKSVQFAILHPPYVDVVKFCDKQNNLSQFSNLDEFLDKLLLTLQNSLKFLDKVIILLWLSVMYINKVKSSH